MMATDDQMPQIRPARRWVNIDLAVLAVLLLVFNELLRPDPFLPVQETLQVFEGFHYFYSHFYHFGEIPNWSLYGTYGAPSGLWQLLYLTPASYAAIVLGRLFRMENALNVFNLAILVEQMVLLVGVYKLARLLYARRETVFFVCVGAMGSAVWYSQIWWNFRIYYMVPLLLYFLVSFFLRRQPRYFWFTAITFVISLIGNLTCFAVVWLIMLVVVALVLSWKHSEAWRSLTTLSARNLVPLGAFLALAAVYAAFLRYSYGNIEIGTFGVDPLTDRTPLHTFFTHGQPVDGRTLFRLLLFGWPLREHGIGALDNTLYIGLLPLPLAAYALAKVREVRFLSFACAAVILLWLSQSGGLSGLADYLPGISLFLHHGVLYALTSIVILVCAGFGLDEFLRSGKPGGVVCAALVTLFIADCVVDKYVMSSVNLNVNFNSMDWWRDVGWFWVFLVRLAAYGALGCCAAVGLAATRAVSVWRRRRSSAPRAPARWTSWRLATGGLVAAYVLDLLLFHTVVVRTAPRLATQTWGPDYTSYLDAVAVGRLPFPTSRVRVPHGERTLRAIRATRWMQPPDRVSESIYAFAQYDPWGSYPYLSLWSVGPKRLFEARGRKPEDDPAFARVLACDESKFRLATNPIFADSFREAADLVKKTEALDETLVLRGVPPGMRTAGPRGHAPEEPGTLRLIRGTANQVTLETNVTTDEPTWLVYADAFHPAWRATVNGKEALIAEAYLAFKAVPVGKGKSIVQFAFSAGWGPKLAGVLAVVGCAFCVYVLAEFVILIISPPRATGPLSPEPGGDGPQEAAIAADGVPND